MQEQETEHLSENLLWSAIRKSEPLSDAHVTHTQDCRDCRDFVREVALEAESQGLSAANLLSTR
jgi:hypothetical protein